MGMVAGRCYWIYENGYLQGPFPAEDLAVRKGFSVTMIICEDGDHRWRPVHDVPEIAPILADVAHAEVLSSGDYLPDAPTGADPTPGITSNTKEPDLT